MHDKRMLEAKIVLKSAYTIIKSLIVFYKIGVIFVINKKKITIE